MGRLAKQLNADIDALERGDASVTESPMGDRGEPRPAAGKPNGRILLRISRREHAVLVREAADEGVSLNHYLTEIVCGRARMRQPTRRARHTQRTASRRATVRA